MLKWHWKKIGDKMAKRKKKVENKRILALELYKGFLKAEPDLADQVKAAIEDFKAQGAKWDENIVYCPNDKILLEIQKVRMGEPDAKYFKRLRNATAGLISAVATWDLSKVIYRFDEDFYSELKETEGIEKVPVNMLLHLPYKCLCLQVGDESRFTYLNYDFEFKLYELRIERLFFNDDENRIESRSYFLTLSSDKLQKCIDHTISSGIDNYKRVGLPEFSEKFEETYRKDREIFQSTIQMILFILSQNVDIVENEENKKVRKKYARSGAKEIPKVLDAGYRVGAEIRNVREINVYKNKTEANEQNLDILPSAVGSKKTPHVRRAHWHHFWIGSEKAGNRKLVIRWLSPIAIGSRVQDLSPVVHDVRA